MSDSHATEPQAAEGRAQRGEAERSPNRVAVVIPCLDEEQTIAKVVTDFARALPDATIYVFDNGSRDRTAEVALAAGAQVVHSPRRGKGAVIQHMARAIEADLYVLVDGDDTYPADAAPDLVREMTKGGADMVVATRMGAHDPDAFRVFHRFGNRIISRLVSLLFSTQATDVLSGYRVLGYDLVKVLTLRTSGFEIETELTLQALAKHFRIVEVPIPYSARPAGSESKLDTWSDGLLILRCIFLILKDYKPLLFFSLIAAPLAIAALWSGYGPVREFYETGLVYRVPRAILAVGLGVLATLCLGVGMVLDTISKYHTENIELWRQYFRDRREERPRD